MEQKKGDRILLLSAVLAVTVGFGLYQRATSSPGASARPASIRELRQDPAIGSSLPTTVAEAVKGKPIFLVFKNCLTCSTINLADFAKDLARPDIPILVPEMKEEEFAKLQQGAPGVQLHRIPLDDLDALNPWFDPRAYVLDNQNKLASLQSDPYTSAELKTWLDQHSTKENPSS